MWIVKVEYGANGKQHSGDYETPHKDRAYAEFAWWKARATTISVTIEEVAL